MELITLVYTQTILIPILGILLMAIRKEKQAYKIYATEVLNHTWRATPSRRQL